MWSVDSSPESPSLVLDPDTGQVKCDHCITHERPGCPPIICRESSVRREPVRDSPSTPERPESSPSSSSSSSEDFDIDIASALPDPEPVTLPDALKTTGEEGLFAGKLVAVTSWMHNTADRRALKNTKGTRLSNGDVYPQEAKQDEDNLGQEKLKRGFTVGPIEYEHQTVNGHIDRDEAIYRAAQFYVQVLQKRSEVNMLPLKGTKKDSVPALPAASPMKGKDRVAWYQNLGAGKKYHSLIVKPATFKKREHMFEYFFDFRITPARAIWNLKLAANIANAHQKKNRTFNGEIFCVEYAHALSRAIRSVFYELYDMDELDDDEETNDKWWYFTRLARSAFDEGVVDRQEFINELCDIFTDVFIRRTKNQEDSEYQLQLWFHMFSYYVPSAVQNLVLARRIAVMMAQKLSLMKKEFKKQQKQMLKDIREGTYEHPPDSDDEVDEEPPYDEDYERLLNPDAFSPRPNPNLISVKVPRVPEYQDPYAPVNPIEGVVVKKEEPDYEEEVVFHRPASPMGSTPKETSPAYQFSPKIKEEPMDTEPEPMIEGAHTEVVAPPPKEKKKRKRREGCDEVEDGEISDEDEEEEEREEFVTDELALTVEEILSRRVIKEEPVDEEEAAKEKETAAAAETSQETPREADVAEGERPNRKKKKRAKPEWWNAMRKRYDPAKPDKFVLEVMYFTEDVHECMHHIMSLLYTCISEQPGAMVYNRFFVGTNRRPFMLTQLGGSPFDYLPCRLADIPFDMGDKRTNENFRDLMAQHEKDIINRSELVQNNWVLTFQSQKQHAKLIDGCLDVVAALDAVDILRKGCDERAFERIFMGMKFSRYSREVCARIRLCMTWAITVQRDGQWRGALVAKILKLLLETCPHGEPFGYFGGTHIKLVLIDFINHDLPQPGDDNYFKEFKNFCALFFEFTRYDVFTHQDLYALWTTFNRTYCRRMDLDPNEPIMIKFLPLSTEETENKDRRKEGDTSVGSEDFSRLEESESMKMEVDGDDDSIVEILPEEEDSDKRPELKKETDDVITLDDEEKVPKEKEFVSLITLPVEVDDGYRLLDEEDIPPLEHLVIQLPIPDNRNLDNQRTQILYGNTQTRSHYVAAAKRVAAEFLRIIRKKMFVKWKQPDVMYTRRIKAPQLNEMFQKIKQHTLFDRQSIANWVADGFINTLQSFIDGDSHIIPTFEAFDLICSLFEQTNNVHGLFEYALVLLPRLRPMESVIYSFSSYIMPGLVLSQYCYVLCSYLVKHLRYFVHFDDAKAVVVELYNVMDTYLRADDYPQNGFGRAAAAAIYHLKEQLIKSKVIERSEWDEMIEEDVVRAEDADFMNIFEQGDAASDGKKKPQDYNPKFMMDNFQKVTLRIYMYHEFKKRLPSFEDQKNQYSFVVNAFIAASKLGRDFDGLGELASFCSHWTAHYPEMGNDWMGAFRAICCGKTINYGFSDLLNNIDLSDCSVHYAISTFAVLLASKYCYSVPKMISELINSVCNSVIKKESGKAAKGGSSYKENYESEPNVCIALLYLVQISCANDDPFILSEHYRGRGPVKKLLEWGSADLNILNMLHWCEMDRTVFPMIVNVGIMNDTLQTRVRDHDVRMEVIDGPEPPTREYKKEFLPVIIRQVLISMCEQDWVKDRIQKVADQDDMAAFNHDRLKMNGLGQQLLRLGTRRRCEREVLAELSVCNGNSKKALIDKLFSVLNIWNFQATIVDLRLMIKGISPEVSNKHAQQGAIAAEALMGEIAKCCRELFVQAHKNNKIIMKKDERFSFSALTNYLLIPTLINMCPTPSNMPSSFSASFKSKFLTEVGNMLDVGTEPSPEKLKLSAWLIYERSFLNIIMACMNGNKRDDQTAKDNFLASLLKQIQDLSKIKENPHYHVQTTHGDERKGIFLRIQLVAYIFDEVCRTNTAEQWALMFFQLMLHGVITPMRNLGMYNMVFDMLQSIIMWSLTDESTSAVIVTDKTGQDTKYRFPNYMGIVKKLRKELHETRTMPETKNLHAFLPLPKNITQLLVTEPFGTPQPNGRPQSVVKQANLGLRRGRPCLQIKKTVERIKITAFEMLQAYNPDGTTKKFPGIGYYMACRLDMSMLHPYQRIQRMIGHAHPLRGCTTNPLALDKEDGDDINEWNDCFLNPVYMDEVGTPPWVARYYEKKKKEKEERERKERGETEAEDKEKKDSEEEDEKKDDGADGDDNEKDKDDKEGVKSEVVSAIAGSQEGGKASSVEVKNEIKQEVREEEVVVLDSPNKNAPTPVATSTPIKESELAKVMSQPLQATALTAHLPPSHIASLTAGPSTGTAPAPIKATRRRSTAKDGAGGAEKKERKRPNKRNAAGLTLQTTANPPLMSTPPKATSIMGGPLRHPSDLSQPSQLGAGSSQMTQPALPPSQLTTQLNQPPQYPQAIASQQAQAAAAAQAQSQPQSYMGTNPDWQTPQSQTTNQPTMQQDQFAPPNTSQNVTLSQLMSNQSSQQAALSSSSSQLPSHIQQQLQHQQQMHSGMSQQGMQQGGMSQQSLLQQQLQSGQHDPNGADAKKQLHDMIEKRREASKAQAQGVPDYISPSKNQPSMQQKRPDAPHPSMGGAPMAPQQPALPQQSQTGVMQPAAPQMGQAGMMQQQQQQQRDHSVTNQKLATHIKNQQALHQRQAAGNQPQAMGQPGGSTQPGQYSQYPQGTQPSADMMRDPTLAQQQQRGAANPATQPSSQQQSSMDQQRRRMEAQQMQQQQLQQQNQQQMQQMQQGGRGQQQRSMMGQPSQSNFIPDTNTARDPTTMGQPQPRVSGGSSRTSAPGAGPTHNPMAQAQMFPGAPSSSKTGQPPPFSAATQQQMQQQQPFDPAFGPPPSKMPAMGSGSTPYPNRPGAPAHNQSTNQPGPQQQQQQPATAVQGQQIGYQNYPQNPQQQQQQRQPTPEQMERMKKQQAAQMQMQQMQQMQGQGQQRMSSMQRQPSQGILTSTSQQPQSSSQQQQQQMQQQRMMQQQNSQQFQQAQQALIPPSDRSSSQQQPSQQQSQQYSQRQQQQYNQQQFPQ